MIHTLITHRSIWTPCMVLHRSARRRGWTPQTILHPWAKMSSSTACFHMEVSRNQLHFIKRGGWTSGKTPWRRGFLLYLEDAELWCALWHEGICTKALTHTHHVTVFSERSVCAVVILLMDLTGSQVRPFDLSYRGMCAFVTGTHHNGPDT